MRVVVVALAGCLALIGCSDGGRADPDAQPATQVSLEPGSPTASSEPSQRGRPVTLPDLTAVEFRDARERLAADRLSVRADVVPDCHLLKGVIVAQQPAPGTEVRRGDAVTLTFGRRPRGTECPPRLARLATSAFLDWASGSDGPPAFAPRVRLLQGNRQVAVLPTARAASREAWRLPTGYAERIAFNLLDWMDDQVLLQPSRGVSAYCLERVATLPPDLVDRLWWSYSLHTASADACMQMAAVQVWVDDAERIAAVNFLIGSP